MIEVENVTKRFGEIVAVRDVSFTALPGRVTGLLGPNGAGKTTILRTISGYHYPTSGRVRISGIDVEERPVEAKGRTGYLPESASFHPDERAYDALRFAADALVPGKGGEGRAKRSRAVDRAIAACGLEAVLARRVGELSKGFRQRVALAQAIVHDPDVLVLDEPGSGLDPLQNLEMRALIRDFAVTKTVLLSTHALAEAEALCERVVIVSEGAVVAEGEPGNLSSRATTTVAVVLRASSPVALEEVAALPGVVSCRSIASPPEGGGFELDVEGGFEAFAHAFHDFARAKGAVVMEFSPRKTSLEETFARLAAEGGGK